MLTRRHLVAGGIGVATTIATGLQADTSHRQPEQAPAQSECGKLVVELTARPGIRLDIRYATPTISPDGCFMIRHARFWSACGKGAGQVRIKAAAADGFGLTIFDAYRPWRITKALWDATPPGPKRNYVANPKKGSKHNRGCAVGSVAARSR
jgi:D-alanyl-D-alanine dipeptidase